MKSSLFTGILFLMIFLLIGTNCFAADYKYKNVPLISKQIDHIESYNGQFNDITLKNMVFHLYEDPNNDDDIKPVKLKNGINEKSQVNLESYVFGKLINKNDAAVIISQTIGNGSEYTLAVLSQKNDTILVSQVVLFYPDIIIEKIEIKNERILLNVLYRGPNEPKCCPTQKGTIAFKYENGKIIETKKLFVGNMGFLGQ